MTANLKIMASTSLLGRPEQKRAWDYVVNQVRFTS